MQRLGIAAPGTPPGSRQVEFERRQSAAPKRLFAGSRRSAHPSPGAPSRILVPSRAPTTRMPTWPATSVGRPYAPHAFRTLATSSASVRLGIKSGSYYCRYTDPWQTPDAQLPQKRKPQSRTRRLDSSGTTCSTSLSTRLMMVRAALAPTWVSVRSLCRSSIAATGWPSKPTMMSPSRRPAR
jgi:hypothetical protein